ncbi:TIGR01777 family oxidoreductase [Photobacterium sp. SDRW27]|uniref:TIGR01777 family oxidoreductase n=1 Tax=Photobacterium obscurum TaxID=2829490 RepID=UPI002243273B|nr:TIGR01777 family oxidoreductase [Photobacterium obscurum]MCW8331635.1 TIGR01777 family oxidoreductase [Photobacterium obscurum]
MNIFVTGGTGFIGKALLPHFNHAHDHVTVLSRDPNRAYQRLGHHIKVISSLDELTDFNDIDVIINLAGEPIVNKRWSDKQKEIICQSRWKITNQLVEKIKASSNPPHTFISGSAVGIYGDQKAVSFDENLEVNNTDFAHQVCRKWEEAALAAQSEKTRVCLLRTGIVLAKQGGALARMLPAYQLGLGGPLGNGEQYFPWIHLNDMVKGILFLLKHPEASGAYNFTSPNPVTNKEFSQTLAHVLHRPHIFKTPAWLLKLGLGESASLLLDSQRALPARLQQQGFHFCYPKLEHALKETLG